MGETNDFSEAISAPINNIKGAHSYVFDHPTLTGKIGRASEVAAQSAIVNGMLEYSEASAAGSGYVANKFSDEYPYKAAFRRYVDTFNSKRSNRGKMHMSYKEFRDQVNKELSSKGPAGAKAVRNPVRLGENSSTLTVNLSGNEVRVGGSHDYSTTKSPWSPRVRLPHINKTIFGMVIRVHL